MSKIITNSPSLPNAVEAADKTGVDVALVCAIVMTESSWRPAVHNLGPGDIDRGGAYGLGQITLATAKALGFSGSAAVLQDPDINLLLVCKLIKDNTHKGETVSDVICRYNSGKPLNRAPTFTTTVYLPRVLNYLQAYRAFLRPASAPSEAAAPMDQHLTLAGSIKPV